MSLSKVRATRSATHRLPAAPADAQMTLPIITHLRELQKSRRNVPNCLEKMSPFAIGV